MDEEYQISYRLFDSRALRIILNPGSIHDRARPGAHLIPFETKLLGRGAAPGRAGIAARAQLFARPDSTGTDHARPYIQPSLRDRDSTMLRRG